WRPVGIVPCYRLELRRAARQSAATAKVSDIGCLCAASQRRFRVPIRNELGSSGTASSNPQGGFTQLRSSLVGRGGQGPLISAAWSPSTISGIDGAVYALYVAVTSEVEGDDDDPEDRGHAGLRRDLREDPRRAPPEKRLLGLTPEQRLAGLAPEQHLAGLAP